MKLIVISICKDEASTIGELIGRIPARIAGISKIETIVIDDGSSDQTAKLARRAGAKVMSDGAAKGLAFRFREATEIALEHEADVMVNIDGDLQFAPEDIPKLVAPIVAGRADFVAADRFTSAQTGVSVRPKNMPMGKYLGNKLGAWVTSRLSRQSFVDVTCGFRAYNREALFALSTTGTNTYTQESFQILASKRLRIVAVPTTVKYYPGRQSRVVTSVPKYVAVSGVNILRAYRDFAPLRFFFWLGFVPSLLGVLFISFVAVHWLQTGDFTPYKFLGITGLYLLSLGIFLWGLGVVADMLVRISSNQEKAYEQLRRMRYEKKR